MPVFVRTRLSAMMFLFYCSLGTWAITSSSYLKMPVVEGGLGFSHAQVGWVYSTFALGGLMAHPLVGLLSDRLFRAERVFGIACLLCSGMLFAAWLWCEQAEWQLLTTDDVPVVRQRAFFGLFLLMLAYSFCLQMGLPLATVLSLRNLTDPARQFSRTRLWGTVGWVVIGLLLPLLVQPRSSQPFALAGGIVLVCGLYAFTLPPTFPAGRGRSLAESFGLPALKLFRKRSFTIYIITGFVFAVLNQFYAVHGHPYLTARGFRNPEQWMTIGQFAEVTCMFLIPVFDPKRSMKWLMLIGALSGAIRGAALAWGPDWVILSLGVPLHGVHFAFFFIVAATYIDREAPPHLRGSSQAISSFVAGGLGPLAGNMLAAAVLEANTTDGQIHWPAFWMWPLVVCSLASVLFLVGFRTPAPQPGPAPI